MLSSALRPVAFFTLYIERIISMKNFEIALTAVAIFTSLLTEGIKHILDEIGTKYKPNVLAAIMSVVTSVLFLVGYTIYYDLAVTGQLIVMGISLVILSFLCATLGYDKVKQTIKQILG